jgi:protein-disulfide isomerase
MKLFTALTMTALLLPAGVRAGDEQFRKNEIENTIRAYLLEHPEILIEMSQALQKKQAEAQRVKAQGAISTQQEALLADVASPVAGPAKAPVTIVEFFDYRCGYCKKVNATVQKLMAEDPALRVVYKELPILGPESNVAATAALAAHQQGRYVKFHNALMGSQDLSLETILRLAGENGLDPARLQKDMDQPAVQEALARNRSLSEALAIQATPAFVIGDEVVPGAIDEAAFRSLIAKAKAKGRPQAGK